MEMVFKDEFDISSQNDLMILKGLLFKNNNLLHSEIVRLRGEVMAEARAFLKRNDNQGFSKLFTECVDHKGHKYINPDWDSLLVSNKFNTKSNCHRVSGFDNERPWEMDDETTKALAGNPLFQFQNYSFFTPLINTLFWRPDSDCYVIKDMNKGVNIQLFISMMMRIMRKFLKIEAIDHKQSWNQLKEDIDFVTQAYVIAAICRYLHDGKDFGNKSNTARQSIRLAEFAAWIKKILDYQDNLRESECVMLRKKSFDILFPIEEEEPKKKKQKQRQKPRISFD